MVIYKGKARVGGDLSKFGKGQKWKLSKLDAKVEKLAAKTGVVVRYETLKISPSLLFSYIAFQKQARCKWIEMSGKYGGSKFFWYLEFYTFFVYDFFHMFLF
jgi:hypothetical protein